MMELAVAPVAATGGPRFIGLLSARGWSLYAIAAVVLFIVFPVLHLVVPPDNALHLSDYWVTLLGKIM